MFDAKYFVAVVLSRTRLLFIFILLSATDALASLSALLPSSTWSLPECKPCAIDQCVDATNCRGGLTMDACNCCKKCLNVKGELCGGVRYRLGRCDKNLFCNITGPFRRDPVGRCEPLISRSNTKEVQDVMINWSKGTTTTPTERISVTSKLEERQGRQLNSSPELSNANKLKKQQKDWLDKSSENDEKGSRKVNDEISGLIVKIDPPFHDQDKNTKTKTLKKDIGEEHNMAVHPSIAPAVTFVACSACLVILGLVATTCMTGMKEKANF